MRTSNPVSTVTKQDIPRFVDPRIRYVRQPFRGRSYKVPFAEPVDVAEVRRLLKKLFG